MISNLFDRMTRLSIRFRWLTLALTAAILVAGIFAMTDINLELLPRIEFPQTVIVAQWSEAESSQEFLEQVTLPIEESLDQVANIVNVESTTNEGFAFIIARNDFGIDQDEVVTDIEAALAGADLPQGMEMPQVLNFSLADLPVVVASISSAELSLPQLKELVSNDLQPRLEQVEQVSRVAVSGGQELPDESAATEGGAEMTPEEEALAALEEDPGRLPALLIEGLKSAGLEIEYAQDVTPEVLAGLTGSEEQVMAVLNLIQPPQLLLFAPPETLSLLPSEFIDTLDPEIQQELDELASEFGGTRQYDLAQVVQMLNEQAGAATEELAVAEAETAEATVAPTEVAPVTTAEPAQEPVLAQELPQVPPVDLPESWIAAASAAGFSLSSTADITEEVMGAIVGFAPQLLADLEPPMWRALDPAAAAIALSQGGEDLDPELLAQLQALLNASTGTEPEPLPLPEAWVTAAAGAGITLETTADIPAQAMSQLGSFAPQLLQELSPELLLALAPDTLAALPSSYVEGLEDGLRQTVENIAILHERYVATNAVPELIVEDPARLPDLMIQGAQAAGLSIEFAQDITPDLVRTMASFGPQGVQFLAMLTPDHLRLMPAESIALLPQAFLESLEPALLAELDELAADFGGAGQLALDEAAAADPARLPEVLIAGAASFGVEIEFAQDITPEFIRPLASAGPQAAQLFALLTEDHLRLLQPEVIALLPQDFLETLDPELRAELDELAADFGGAGQLALDEAEAAAAASADSPPLSGVWLEPGADGTPSMFQTAGDLLNNPFVAGAAALLNFLPNSPQVEDPSLWMSALTPEVMAYLADNEDGFAANLSPVILELMSPETLTFLLDSYPEAFDEELAARLSGIAAGTVTAFVPEASITRTDGNPSVIVNLFKDGDANTVEVAHRIFDLLEAYKAENPDITTDLVFEQATFIEDSIEGVAREGALGALFAVVVILIFLSGHVGGKYKLSWRATLVTGTSIPLSVFAAFFLMRWVPPTIGTWMHDLANSSGNGVLNFISQLFPTSVTLNIMTLSGLTVAIGRVVDDSIVVLENSYRYIQRGQDPKSAVLQGTKEVAIAIFSATATTVAVFLPLGLIGGIVGSFFLPFGLTVTYALVASFIVSITVVPALTYLLIRREHIPEERETTMQRWYTPILKWAIGHRFYTMAIATVIFLASLLVLGQLPQSFIPAIGEPTINVSLELPQGTLMAETDALVSELEAAVTPLHGVETVQTEIGGGGGFESFFGGGGVSQNLANMTISVHEQDDLVPLTNEIRAEAERILGKDSVVVSAAAQTGFGGFSMTVTGDSLDQLRAVVDEVKVAIGSVDLDGDGISDIANVSSNVDNGDALGAADTIIRIDGRPAISFGGELETSNTLGVTNAAKEAIIDLGLPSSVEVTEGFESEQQVEGFRSMMLAIGYSVVIVYLIMALTFRSLIHPFTILFSLPFALVGAALALLISNSVLGISAMIGLMMLVGIVVTNGIVLMELVQQLRRRGSDAREALVRGGRTRLRPIWMTALAAILALIPLGLSQEAGAIIASELALVVMGGLLVSTALTLVVVPVVYSLFDDIGARLNRRRA